MRVRMTMAMLKALKATPEIPDNLLACVENAEAAGDAFAVELGGDEAMAMEEMCQWYIQKDPETGEMTSKSKLFDLIVRAIYDAEDAV